MSLLHEMTSKQVFLALFLRGGLGKLKNGAFPVIQSTSNFQKISVSNWSSNSEWL